MKSFLKWLVIVIAIVVVFPFAFSFVSNRIEVYKFKPQLNTEVSFGETFSLKENGNAHIKDTDVSIHITKLNSGSRVQSPVLFNLIIGDKTYKYFGHEMQNAVYAEDKPFVQPYDILIKETDYEAYVNLIINKK